MTHERPTLGADPLRPPPADFGADPILDSYGAEPAIDEPAGEAAGVPLDAEAVTGILVGIFDGLAQLRGPHWHAEPAEFAMAAPPIARELNKPDTTLAAWLAAHGDALLIVVGLGAVIVPRAVVEYQVMRYRRAQLAAEQESAPYATDPYGFTYPVPDHARAAAPEAPSGPRDGVREPGADQQSAGTRETDPGSLAAAIGAVIG